jgi:protein arginine kinase activator
MTEKPADSEDDNKLEKSFEEKPKEALERPLECSECKKPVSVEYTEIVGTQISHTCMCSDCPVLQQHLHGVSSSPEGISSDIPAGLCCGRCGTTLEAVRMGNPVGCEECYEVFADVLVAEMIGANKVHKKVAPDKTTKSVPIHIGRSPGETAEINPSLRLIALNDALNDVLKREDYEQAAWLRDQIKELEGKSSTSENPDGK